MATQGAILRYYLLPLITSPSNIRQLLALLILVFEYLVKRRIVVDFGDVFPVWGAGNGGAGAAEDGWQGPAGQAGGAAFGARGAAVSLRGLSLLLLL